MDKIEEYIANKLTDVENGNSEAILLFAELDGLEKLIKAAKAQIKDEALDEATEYGKSFELKGYSFELRSGRRNYDFKHIPKWVELNNSRKQLEELSKKAEETEIYDADGERIEPPVVTYSSDSLIIK